MKKYLNLFMLVTAAFMLLACDKNASKEDVVTKRFSIVKANLGIAPDGGECTIEVDAPEAVTATPERDWCTAAVSGSTITVTATANLSSESRYCRIKLQSGKEILYATVQQFGEVVAGLEELSVITAPVAGRKVEIGIKINIPIFLTAAETWVHPRFEDGKIIVEIDPNDEPRTRFCPVNYSAGSVSGSFQITQYPELTKPESWVITEGTPTFEYPEFSTTASLSASEEDMYVLRFVPKSQIKGSVDDWIFDQLAVEVRNAILDQTEAHPETSFKDYLSTGVAPVTFNNINMGENYIIAIGFGDNGYVSGRYQYKEVTIDDVRPAYYKWAGKWTLTGKNIEGADYSETFEITVDEANVDEQGKMKEQYLLVTGLCSKNQEAAKVTDPEVGTMRVLYSAEDKSITFYGQEGTKTFTSASYGSGCKLQLVSMYVKAGATSYTNVTGGSFIKLQMNSDGSTTTLTPLERSAGLLYKAFKIRVLNAAGSAYTVGGNASTIAINDYLTIIRAN